MKKVLICAFAAFGLLAGCEYRTPMEFEEPPRIRIEPHPSNTIGARTQNLELDVIVTDADNNVLPDTLAITFQTLFGVIVTEENEGTDIGKQYMYYYPDSVSAILHDTVTAVLYYNGKSDSVTASTAITILPRDMAVGHLDPHSIRLEARSDTVFKAGAGWKMWYHATVSDSLDNPVTDSVSVVFSLVKGTVDTSQVSIGNISWTGASRCINDLCDSLGGEAITTLSYTSHAIGDSAIIRAQVMGTDIVDFDTLELPLPRAGLHLFARDANLGPVIVDRFTPDTATFEVVLHDAFGVPVPGRRITLSVDGGELLPLCSARDERGDLVTVSCDCRSLPCPCPADPAACGCDTIVFNPCRITNWGGDPDTLCDSLVMRGPHCDTIGYGNTGVTDRNGSFIINVQVRKEHQKDEETLSQELIILLREQGNQEKEADFELSIPVLFKI
jgi:hypothetical protein